MIKNKNLINQIDSIMESGKVKVEEKLISAGYFKNNTQLLSTLQNQKNIANHRQQYLIAEKKVIQSKIISNNIKKIKAEEKSSEYKKSHREDLDNKSYGS